LIFSAGIGNVRKPSPRSSSLDLNNYLPYRLLVVTAKVTQTYARRYEDEFGISIPESRILNVIGQHKVLNSTEVCELTTMTKSRVSTAVNRLVASGLLTRAEDEVDQRIGRLAFSAKGRSLYKKIVPVALEMEEQLISSFGTGDRDTFMNLLASIERNL
jgi:DNA-binding MarR family transcriptional regulator